MSRISLYSDANQLRTQQQKLYRNDFTDCSFAFEFIAMDTNASYSVSPEFERISNNVGFADVDSVAIMNVSSNNFSRLFFFETSDFETIQSGTGADTTIRYGILGSGGANPFINFSYAYSQIKAGFANPSPDLANNTFLYQDYVRYTAKTITGGYALSDLFSNEQELLKGVAQMDPLFNNNFSVMLSNMSNVSNTSSKIINSGQYASSYNYLISCKTLVDNLLSDANTSNNVSALLRGKQFLRDMKQQSDEADLIGDGDGISSNKYWVFFYPGDVMAVRLTYLPKNGDGRNASNAQGVLGGNPLYNRSYKIYLKMT